MTAAYKKTADLKVGLYLFRCRGPDKVRATITICERLAHGRDSRRRFFDLRQAGNLSEHLGTDGQDEREAVVPLHPPNRNAHQAAVLIQHASSRHTGMPVGEAGDQAVRRALPNEPVLRMMPFE